jgi:hypothetical protein
MRDKVYQGYGLNLVATLESILTYWTYLRPSYVGAAIQELPFYFTFINLKSDLNVISANKKMDLLFKLLNLSLEVEPTEKFFYCSMKLNQVFNILESIFSEKF